MLTIAATVASTDIVGVIPTWLYDNFHHLDDIRVLDSDVKLDPFPLYKMYSKMSLQSAIFKNRATWLENDFTQMGSPACYHFDSHKP